MPKMSSPSRWRYRLLGIASTVAAMVVIAPGAFANTTSVTFGFGKSGTWTVPDRVTEIEVEVAGGGGGGHSAPGGNGALVRALIEVSSGMSFDFGVGGGGEALNSAKQSGGGGASILESGDILIIVGGGGGANGWGAYELTDDAGNLTSVFIPAGGWTRASSDTRLFPIWAE